MHLRAAVGMDCGVRSMARGNDDARRLQLRASRVNARGRRAFYCSGSVKNAVAADARLTSRTNMRVSDFFWKR